MFEFICIYLFHPYKKDDTEKHHQEVWVILFAWKTGAVDVGSERCKLMSVWGVQTEI